jgi:excisionase family DNA binding protein
MTDDTSETHEETETVGGNMGDLFTLAEAAHYLSVRRQTLESYALRQRIEYQITGGGQFLFRRGDLDAIAPIINANKERYRSEESARKRRKGST